MTAVWYIIVAICALAAIINFTIAGARRKQPLVALVRVLAGLVSLAAVAGIIIGKSLNIPHPFLDARNVFIGFGVFVFAVLLLPSYADRSAKDAPKVTMQQRAARPANATVRLRDAGTDEWVN